MAEALARVISDGSMESCSAGTEPNSVHQLAIRAMAEIGMISSSAFEERRIVTSSSDGRDQTSTRAF